jgi:acyl-CoA hydrolase
VEARLAGVGRSSPRVELLARAEDPVRRGARDVCRATSTMATVRDGAAEPVRLHGAGAL